MSTLNHTPLNALLVQANIIQENPQANRLNLELLIKQAAGAPFDVIILPEMFTTGFTMQPQQCAEKADNSTTIQWLQQLATNYNALIIGSVVLQTERGYHNRLLAVSPDGKVLHYDKRHLFSIGGEHLHYQAGESVLKFRFRGVVFCTMVCYDLRFPVWSHNQDPYYDVLVYVANWPSRRSHHWTRLLAARAIENQAFVIGVNRVGYFGDVEHDGHTVFYDYHGEGTYADFNTETTLTVQIDRQALLSYREAFPALKDTDKVPPFAGQTTIIEL